jgi:hypothetical protein
MTNKQNEIMFIEEHPIYKKSNRTLTEEIKLSNIKICEDCGIILNKGFSCDACNDVEEQQ